MASQNGGKGNWAYEKIRWGEECFETRRMEIGKGIWKHLNREVLRRNAGRILAQRNGRGGNNGGEIKLLIIGPQRKRLNGTRKDHRCD